MKKIYQFLRSMRFGVILLVLIAVLCAGATASGNESVYSSWYFILLFAMLAVNLTLCSVSRVTKIGGSRQEMLRAPYCFVSR